LIVLGIDPGTVAAGYGAVERRPGGGRLLDCGAVRAPRGRPLAERLRLIHDGLAEVIRRVRPDVAVVEKPFAGTNLATAIAIGEARGVALLACAARSVPVAEYSPAEIKRSVTGRGSARKEQVALMVKTILGLAEAPRPADATDALAAAICWLHREPERRAAAAAAAEKRGG
jgi:crossover junction endodeoxyribonuclease RuvC